MSKSSSLGCRMRTDMIKTLSNPILRRTRSERRSQRDTNLCKMLFLLTHQLMKIYHSLLDSLQMLLSKFLLKIPHFRLLDERCDSLYEQVQGLESDLQIKETHLISLKHSLDDSERRNQEITGANKHNVSLCISLENTI